MSVEVSRDHHRMRLVVPIAREGWRRWLGVLAAAVGLAFVPGELVWRAAALGVVAACAVFARDRRQTVLTLSHDTLTLESPQLGDPITRIAPWDAVAVTTDDSTLIIGLDGEEHRIAWGGRHRDLVEAVEALRDGRTRFVPGQGAVAPEPAELERLRGRQQQ